jgi:Na+/H+ antiporter NhaA
VLLGTARLVGKIVGIVGVVSWMTRRNPHLAPGSKGQVASLAALCAVGFTVPLLFASQAYGSSSTEYFLTTVTLLAVSLVAVIAGCTTLWFQGRPTEKRTA